MVKQQLLKEQTKMKKILFTLILALTLLSVASASTQAISVFEMTTYANGNSPTLTNNPINNVNIIGYYCTSDYCSQDTNPTALWTSAQSTGTNSNTATLTYPNPPAGQKYTLYVYKEGYSITEVDVAVTTPGTITSIPIYLTEKDGFSVELDNLILTPSLANYEKGNTLDISTNIHSPITRPTPKSYIPNEVKRFYQTGIKTTLEITGPESKTLTQTNIVDNEATHQVDFPFIPSKIGTYTIKATTEILDSQFQNSQPRTKQTTVTVTDTTAPIITNIQTTPSESPIYTNQDKTIKLELTSNEYPLIANFKLEDASGQTVDTQSITLADQTNLPANYNLDADPLADGTYTLSVSFEDTEGNENTPTVIKTIIIDKTNPSLTIDSPTATTYTSNPITIDIRSEDSNPESLTYDYGTGPINYPGSQETLSFEDGTHTITFKATDKAGNYIIKTTTFTVDTSDTEDPVLTVNSPTATTYPTNQVSFDITATENVGIQSTWFNSGSGDDTQYTAPTTLTLADGTYTYTFRTKDTSGNNATPKSVTFTVDTSSNPPVDNTPPVFTNLADKTIKDNVQLSYQITATDTGGSGVNSFTVSDTTNFAITDAGLLTSNILPVGPYSLTITVTDNKGNYETGTITITVESSTIPDTTKPEITIVSPTPNSTIDSKTITIQIQTNEASTATFNLDNGGSIPLDSTDSLTFTYSLTNLAEGEHEIVFKAKDASNNEATTTIKFTIDLEDKKDKKKKKRNSGDRTIEFDILDEVISETTATVSAITKDAIKLNVALTDNIRDNSKWKIALILVTIALVLIILLLIIAAILR